MSISNGFYVDTCTVPYYTTFTTPEGFKIVDGSADTYCRYVTFHGLVTENLSRLYVTGPDCPWFDTGPRPLLIYSPNSEPAPATIAASCTPGPIERFLLVLAARSSSAPA